MSTKTRVFTVSASEPVAHPFSIIAHSKTQLARRLADAFHLDASLLEDVADALWKGSPVFFQDSALVLLPGRFSGVSYQTLPQ